MPYSYSRRYRLASKQEVQSVFDAKPKKYSHHYLLVLTTPNQLNHARLGIIVGKQHVRLAVDRNRVRRIIRESFRQKKIELKGFDLIVIVRAQCAKLDSKTIRNDIDHLWQAIPC